MLIAGIPAIWPVCCAGGTFPMGRVEVGFETDEIGDTFDETAWGAEMVVILVWGGVGWKRRRRRGGVLVAMDEFVSEDADEFLAGIGVGGGGADVGEGEVDFLVVVVEVGAGGVGDAAEVAQDDGHRASWGD